MTTKKRTYNDLCGLSHALELVGERWAILVLRELSYGPKRFTDIRSGLPSASPNVLSQRLRELEAHGIVRRRTLAPPAASKVYELTDWGREIEPTLRSLGRWAARSPHFPDTGHFSPSSLAMNLETMFLADKAAGLDLTFALRLGDESFTLRIAGGKLELERGEAGEPDAAIDTDPMTLISILYYDEDLSGAEKAGTIRIEGDRSAVASLPELFELPDPVELETATA
jgi:DNA-binding HxlR family transcriptional regulator/putative sterol carrier protein